MIKPRNPLRLWRELNDVAWISLMTGLGILLVALLGAIINPLVGNWIQSGGMAIVGLFYLVLFLTNLPPRGISAIGAAELLSQRPRSRHDDSDARCPADFAEEDAISR